MTETGREGVIEIALDPPELGRVRLSLAEAGGGLTLSISAERPDTAELMRRHLDLLQQELARAGFDGPSLRLALDQDGRSTPPTTRPDAAEAEPADSGPAPVPPQAGRAAPLSALDLRI
ncbi:flagellar hook-length control protein [Roseibacterium elongatum DSM 19469]|uniref:Flagellar hook-length control protein n=1 Tax=Roseicyclus elongatus DSM 19469 TaxID=1294273 RepID=W8SMC6_9RHOB|nr:flagellar hook-length control protein FliK [Roseibacterium elongatum]AHM03695.1 flagellar hook-length control protein [Roseibacterium elongatum DSM 19469]